MAKPVLLIDKTIMKVKYLFTITGINLKLDKTRKDKYRCWFLYIFNSIWVNTDVVGAILWFFDGIALNKNFTELTYVAPCAMFCCLSNIKTIYVVVKESTIDVLIFNIRELELKQNEREKDVETEKIIKTEDNYLNKVINLFNVFYIVQLISFAVSPILLIFLNYYTTNKVELQLPFLVVYPFDPLDMKYYPWVYLHQIWSEIVVAFGIFAADCAFYIFCVYLRMQFRLLSYYMEHLIPEESKQAYNGEEIRSKLVELVQWHQELKSSVDLLETVYTRPTLFNFIASSVLICLTGFNVMAIDDIAFVITFLTFLLMSLLQIFFQCFFSDLLMESSMKVGDAIYNSRWYLADISLRKSLLLILTRAQTPCKLTASNYADVNLNAFMKICSTAWSYFALLQTLYTSPPE